LFVLLPYRLVLASLVKRILSGSPVNLNRIRLSWADSGKGKCQFPASTLLKEQKGK